MTKINLKAQSLLGFRLNNGSEVVRAGAKGGATAGAKGGGGGGGGLPWWWPR